MSSTFVWFYNHSEKPADSWKFYTEPSEATGDEAVQNALAGHRAVQTEASARGELHAVARSSSAVRQCSGSRSL